MHNDLDRGMIKWAPFNSVVSSKKMVNEILKEKNKVIMPMLSDEQKNILEKNLVIAFYENEKISLKYYYSGNIYTFSDYIKKIDFTYHKIYFNNKTLLFEQIVSASIEGKSF